MHIDARDFELQDLLKKLKDLLASSRECNMDLDILVKTVSEAKKIKGFVSMSGCSTEIDKKDNFYIIHVRGVSCCS